MQHEQGLPEKSLLMSAPLRLMCFMQLVHTTIPSTWYIDRTGGVTMSFIVLDYQLVANVKQHRIIGIVTPMVITLSYPQWHQALTVLGWGDPYPANLWGYLGGGEIVSLDRARVDSLAASLGWSGDHAHQLWTAVSGQGPMPWEQPPKPSSSAPKTSTPAPPKRPELAFMLRRLAGALVDGAVFGAALLLVCSLGKVSLGVAVGREAPSGAWPQLLLVMLTVTAVMLLYFSWSMRRPSAPGQSLGKQLFSLRVVCSDGSPVSARQVLLRQGLGVVLLPWLVVWGLNLLIWPLGLAAGFLMLLLSAWGVGLADRAAQTKVIRA